MSSSRLGLGSLVAALTFGLGAGSSAQTIPSAASTRTAPVSSDGARRNTSGIRFKTGVDLVAVDVCVKNREGRLLPDLTKEDFLVLEDDRPQRIALFAPDDPVSLAVVLLVDGSHSMNGLRLAQAKDAAVAFVQTLRPDDLVEVMSFNDRANRRYPLGGDHVAATRAVESVSAFGQTGLFEAVLVAMRDLERVQATRSIEYRSVILLLSDGEDTSSRITFDHLLEEARRTGIIVYAVSLRDPVYGRKRPPLRELAQLAFDTGGQSFSMPDFSRLTDTYQAISAELRHLYRIGYIPSSTARDGRWRKISVRVKTRDAHIRARSGYYAPLPPVMLKEPRPRGESR